MVINLPLFFVLAAGAIQSLFMGSCMFQISRKKTSDVLLAFLLVMIGFRLLKSTLFIYEEELPLWIINSGFGAHAAVAVLIWLYVKSTAQSFRWNNISLLHFLPSLLLVAFGNMLNLENFWYKGGYHALLYYSLLYLAMAFKEWAIHLKPSRQKALWPSLVLASTALFLLSYFGNYILRLYDYSYAPLPFALAVFPLSFLLWKSRSGKQMQTSSPLRLSAEDKTRLERELASFMTAEGIYLDAGLTLHTLAEKLKVTPHLLSHFLNQQMQSNFSKTVNSYRIEAACRILSDPKRKSEKIATVAYECGFNSLSVFNKAFQEIQGMSPAEYRKRYSINSKWSVEQKLTDNITS